MSAAICHLRVERRILKDENFGMPLALVTCGPAHEPIDGVRRITNQSTGELGTILSECLSAHGFEVLCLRGEMAAHPAPKNAKVVAFSTNASLMNILERLPVQPVAVFHAAALCDFMVHRIEGTDEARKIRSTVAELHLILRPAEKILPRLRALFPETADRGLEIRTRRITRGRRRARPGTDQYFKHQCLRCQRQRLWRRFRIPGARERAIAASGRQSRALRISRRLDARANAEINFRKDLL